MSTAPAIPENSVPHPAPAVNSTVRHLRDFPDKLSPMLVKELRQGMHSNLFLIGFMVLHAVLILITVTSLGEPGGGRGSSYLFWWSVALGLGILIPLRGYSALADEMRLNTLDTLILTRLSAWRITFGKWCAIAAQEALIAITVLPYLIMRYFIGGVDLWKELVWLLNFFVIGLLFAASTVGFSWVRSTIARSVFTIGGIIFVVYFIGFAIEGMLLANDPYLARLLTTPGFILQAAFLTLAAFLGYYFLDGGAAQIAPLSENRTSLRRTVTLVVMGAIFWIGTAAGFQAAAILSILLTALVATDVLSEPPRHLSVIAAPFVRRGPLGKFAGRFLYPGWHSGLLFFVLLCAISAVLFGQAEIGRSATITASYGGPSSYPSFFNPDFNWLRALFPVSLALGVGLYGFLILRIFLRNSSSPQASLLLILVATGLLHLMLSALESSMRQPFLKYLAAFSPGVWLMEYISGRSTYLLSGRMDANEYDSIYAGCAIHAVVYLFLSLGLALAEFRKTRQAEAQALELLKAANTANPPPAETADSY